MWNGKYLCDKRRFGSVWNCKDTAIVSGPIAQALKTAVFDFPGNFAGRGNFTILDEFVKTLPKSRKPARIVITKERAEWGIVKYISQDSPLA